MISVHTMYTKAREALTLTSLDSEEPNNGPSPCHLQELTGRHSESNEMGD